MNGENGNGSAIVIAETASTLAPVDIKKRLDRFAVKKAKEMEEVFAGLKVEERPKYLAEMGIPVNYSEMPTEVRMTQFQKVAIIYAGANAGKFFADELK